jgi:hypothetical protein
MKLKISGVKTENLPVMPSNGDIRITFVIVDAKDHQISREKKHSSYSPGKGNPTWPGQTFVFGDQVDVQPNFFLLCKLKSKGGGDIDRISIPLDTLTDQVKFEWYPLPAGKGQLQLGLQTMLPTARRRLDSKSQLILRSNVIFSGKLLKKKKQWDSFRWNSRFFVLTQDDELRYYLSETHSTQKGSLQLTERTILKRSTKKEGFGFGIFTDEGKVRLKAETAEMREEWIKVFTGRLQQLQIKAGLLSFVSSQLRDCCCCCCCCYCLCDFAKENL